MTFVGLLEADLQDASEYKTGGIGPLFRETRAEELLSLSEFLSRIIRGLRKAGVRSAVTLFIDDGEVYTDPEAGEEDNLDAVLAAANQPELETWTDWEGAYDPERNYSSAIPGGTGLGG